MMPARIDQATGVVIRSLGRTDYEATWRAMQAFTDTRNTSTPTRSGSPSIRRSIRWDLAEGASTCCATTAFPQSRSIAAGVAYHGPGQLVAYTLVDLRRPKMGVRDMVRRIEGAVIQWLDSVGVPRSAAAAAPGVYVMRDGAEAKIALGLKVRDGYASHQLSRTSRWTWRRSQDMDPCGYPGLAVTQISGSAAARTVESAGMELAPVLAARLSRQR